MKRLALFLLFAVSAPLLSLGNPDVGPASAPHFFAPDFVDPKALIPAPPAPDSLVQRAEIEVLLNLQAHRTPEQVAHARKIQEETVFVFGADVLGEWFSANNLPKTAAFFLQLQQDFRPIGQLTKKTFNRRRPAFQDSRIKPCVEFSDTSSYPSGHSTQSAVWGGLFGVIFPEHKAAFADRAAETRWARLVGGAHHPTDVEAGRVIGEAEVIELLKIPAIQKALAEIQAEVAPFLLKKAA